MSETHKIKYVIAGWYGVGKTSMAEYYVNNKVADSKHQITIGVEFFQKIIEHKDKKFYMQIWDTAGQEQFQSVAKQYFRDPQGGFVCFDITKRDSFEKLEYYLLQLLSINENNVHVILVGTFLDMSKKRAVTYNEAIKIAKKYHLQYFEVSSKTGENIYECFDAMHDAVCKRINEKDESIPLQTYLSNEKIKSIGINEKLCCKM